MIRTRETDFEDQPDRNKWLNQIMTASIPEDQLDQLISDIKESHAISGAFAQAKSYIEEGLRILDDFPAGQERKALTGLAQYIVTRSV